MAIAKQLGYAETAFISESEIADYKFEYFTPKEEVDLCGHATIGSFVILMHLNKLCQNRYTIETNSGVLTITIKDDIIFMEQNKPIFYDVVSPNEFIDCFDMKAIDDKYPIQIVSTGLKDILIPIKAKHDYIHCNLILKKLKKLASIIMLSECIYILVMTIELYAEILLHYTTSMKKRRLELQTVH